MLAVAYRSIDGALKPSGSGANGKHFAKSDRQMRREMQHSATNSLLRDLLEREAPRGPSNWKLTEDGRGKPILITSDGANAIDVSMSHSGCLAAAAITDLGAIGVDLEYSEPARSISEIANYAFGPQERRAVQMGGAADFYRIWTLREALAKACGIGFPMLADGRDYFAVAPAAGSWVCVIDGHRWFFSADELPDGYAIAVAIALRAPTSLDCASDLTIRRFD